MKTLISGPTATLLLLVLLAVPALAQPESGDIILSFDAGGTVTAREVGAQEPFDWYVLGYDLTGGVAGFELGFQYSPALTITQRDIDQPGAAIISPHLFGRDNYIVGYPRCESGLGYVPLVAYSGVYLRAPGADVMLCLAPNGGPIGTPGLRFNWLSCTEEVMEAGFANHDPNGVYPDGCAVINATAEAPLDAEERSWGAVKAEFNQ